MNAAAAIAGTKIDPNFGTQSMGARGLYATGVLTLTDAGPTTFNDYAIGSHSMLDVVNSEYIRTARAKGLSERRVVWKHALRNALIPLVTLWALDFAALLSGSVITESIFSWPGLGPVFIQGLSKPDLDLVMGISYADDIDKAKQIITRVLSEDSRILKDPIPTVAVSELADSSVNFVVRPWVKADDYWNVYFSTTENIKKQFDAQDITIPFPQRDVHVYEHKADG